MDEAAAPPGPPARGSRRLTWALVLAWAALHLAGLAAGGWRLEGNALTWASVDLASLRRHGVLVPALVSEGEVQRLVTGVGAVGGGALSLLLAVWVFASAGGGLERGAGTARAGLVLLASALAGAGLQTFLWPRWDQPLPGAWDLVLGAVGAQIPWGLAEGGRAGRTRISSALAFVALSAALLLLQPGGEPWMLYGQGAAFVAGALTLTLLGPRRLEAAPARGTRGAALLALLTVLAAVGLQARQAWSDPGAARAERLLTALDEVEREALRLWTARDPSRVPRAEREALGRRLTDLRASPDLEGLEGAADLGAYLDALTPIATGELRDPTAVAPRIRAAQARWSAAERTLRLRLGFRPHEPLSWR